MGFKPKAKKAKAKAEAKEKARIEWEAVDEAEQDVMAARADEARALAKAESEAKAKAVADAEAVADADAVAVPAPEPQFVLYEGVKYRPQCIRDQFRRYYAAREDYGPFDVDIFPALLTAGMLSPCNYKTGSLWKGKVNKCVRHAIAFAKKEKKMELADPEVLRANWELSGGYVFYITFKAMDKKSGKMQLYEAKVLIERIVTRKPKSDDTGPAYVRLIRVKNQQKNKVVTAPYSFQNSQQLP